MVLPSLARYTGTQKERFEVHSELTVSLLNHTMSTLNYTDEHTTTSFVTTSHFRCPFLGEMWG